jgi:MAF protein
LSLTGVRAAIRPAKVSEQFGPQEDPSSVARRLALAKAEAAAGQDGSYDLVLAADTVVANGERILGKPAGTREAEEMLLALRGREHRVVTALVLLDLSSGERQVEICETAVPMRAYTAEEVQAYVASGGPFDKAGAYGIQDRGFHPVDVESMTGCYANVMGLPLCHLLRGLRALNYGPEAEVPEACQRHTRYDCSVYPCILGELK